MKLISPKALRNGSTIGIATPSWPANHYFKEKFELGVSNLKKLGFKVQLGSVTARFSAQGYRSGPPQDRARELMELFLDPAIDGIMTTIGGSCSISVIEYLDFSAIAQHPKVFCGYSDITSLHMALMVKAGLRTFYGPALVPSFGEHPDILEYSKQSFLDTVVRPFTGPRTLQPPSEWSNQLRDAFTDEWKTGQRKMQPNSGWSIVRQGHVEAPLVAVNLNTFSNTLGTDVQPNLNGCILLIEEMTSLLEMEERKLWQLRRAGVFDQIQGLIVSKPDSFDACKADFRYTDILLEATNGYKFPIMTEFDCGHTYPMITVAQGTRTRLDCDGKVPEVTVLESGVLY